MSAPDEGTPEADNSPKKSPKSSQTSPASSKKASPSKASPMKASAMKALPMKASPMKASPMKASPMKATPMKAMKATQKMAMKRKKEQGSQALESPTKKQKQDEGVRDWPWDEGGMSKLSRSLADTSNNTYTTYTNDRVAIILIELYFTYDRVAIRCPSCC